MVISHATPDDNEFFRRLGNRLTATDTECGQLPSVTRVEEEADRCR